MSTCTNPNHDHTVDDDDQGNPMACADCGDPCHWEESVCDYRHDDPDRVCFLHAGGSSPCTS